MTPQEKVKKDKELKRRVLIHWAHNLRKAKAGTLSVWDILGDSCAFCNEYRSKTFNCSGCPINEQTNAGCNKTPWRAVSESIEYNYSQSTTIECVIIMIKFLKDLEIK
jgi:hypothetical protein